jgi:hypothetical protein
MLQGYPAETLHEAIVNFHNTEDRFAKFEAALAADKLGRAKDVQEENLRITQLELLLGIFSDDEE